MPRHMGLHSLNALKGWPSQHAVDFAAKYSAAALAAVSPNPVFAGRVGSLNASGQFILGVADGAASQIIMPMYFFHDSDAPCVSNDGGITGNADTDDPEGWASVSRNNAMALVAVGAYELETTEYNKDLTYHPNDCLKADPDDNGVVAKGTRHVDTIVGIVSRGTKKSGQRTRDVLAFWPVVFPPA